MRSRCLPLPWGCLLVMLLTVRTGSAEAEQPQAVTEDKRDWTALHGNWGKRDPAEMTADPDDDLVREVATGLILSGYDDPEEKRQWNGFSGSWGKRARWNNFAGSWGKRSKWNSMGPSWGKRAKWDNFGGSWGKRGKWENFGGSWGKRKNWDNFNGAWGKRKGWDSFSGGWGKRAAWNNFGGSWGKRDASVPDLQGTSDRLENFLVNNYKELQARTSAPPGQAQAKKRKDWTQLNGMWGKRSASKALLLV